MWKKHVISLLLLLLFTAVSVSSATPTPVELPELIDLAWSPDGSTIVGGGTDGLLCLWDAETGEVLRDFQAIEGTVFSVAWSPDSTKFASAGSDLLIHIWDVETGEEIAALEGHLASVSSVAWSPDGSQIASASFTLYNYDNASLRIWDTSTYQQVYESDMGVLTEVVWNPISPDPEVAVSNVNNSIYVQQITSDQLPRRISFEGGAGQYAIAWRSDASQLASGDVDGTVYIVEASDGTLITSFNADTAPITEIIWNPDGTQLATSSLDGTISFWDTTNWTVLHTIEVDGNPYTPSIVWSPDGTRFVYGLPEAIIHIIDTPNYNPH